MVKSRRYVALPLLVSCVLLLSGGAGARAQVATPVASPVAMPTRVDLAAMTPDSQSIPDDFQLLGERYTTVDELLANFLGAIPEDDLRATGIELHYETSYINATGKILRAYVLQFDSIAGAEAGFALLEDEVTLAPSGEFQDLPPLAGVGEEPGEISTGIIENGDGTQTRSYDVSFRIDRFEVGAAMETYNGAEPDVAVVEQLARDTADRVTAVLAGEAIPGIQPDLPDRVISLSGTLITEGYQSNEETFVADDPANLPAGFVSTYARWVSQSDSPFELFPTVYVGVSQFDTTAAVATALQTPALIVPALPKQETLSTIAVAGADALLAVAFDVADDGEQPDSVRLYVQVENRLVEISVEGMETLPEATAAAVAIAELQVQCLADGACDVLGSIETS